MRTHLDEGTIDGLLSRSLDAHRLRELDHHVQGCLECSLAVEAATADLDRWERRGVLGRLAFTTPAREAASMRRAA
jgi:hypothetical protein